MRYCFDTSSWIEAGVRTYPRANFPRLWEQIENLIAKGELVSPDEVLRELEKRDDDLFDWAKQQKGLFVALDEETQIAVAAVLRTHPRFAAQITGRNQADPFVIALAKARKLTVVSEEKGPGSADKPKIPEACKTHDVRCIRLLDLIRELGWKF